MAAQLQSVGAILGSANRKRLFKEKPAYLHLSSTKLRCGDDWVQTACRFAGFSANPPHLLLKKCDLAGFTARAVVCHGLLTTHDG
jgi:hypothetical protein